MCNAVSEMCTDRSENNGLVAGGSGGAGAVLLVPGATRLRRCQGCSRQHRGTPAFQVQQLTREENNTAVGH